MAHDRIRQTLEAFIRAQRSEILVLKGRWGTGKTHLWNEIVNQSKAGLGHEKYAYVSLFGVSSLEEVKTAIVVGMVKANAAGGEKTAHEILRGLKNLLAHANRTLPIAAEWGGALAGALSFLAVKDALICFDDLERRGADLEISQVLGLASFLKDQRNCSVAIILNEDSLDGGERQEFRQHGEKLADIEIEFSRDPEEALGIGLKQSIPYRDTAYERCKTLGVDNIRILRRIGRLIEGAEELLSRCEQVLAENIISSLVLFVWCYYDESGDSPLLTFVRQRSLESVLGVKRASLTQEEGKWVRLLESYGYRYTDALDASLIDYVERGYLANVDTILNEIEARNREIRNAGLEASYREVWKLYTNSFLNNDDELVEKLTFFAKTHMAAMTPLRLNEVVVVLRALEKDGEADELIEMFVAHFQAEVEVFNISSHPFGANVTDSRLRMRFGEVLSSQPQTRNLGDVIRRISRNQSWHPDEIEFLSSKEVEDYVQFFKSEQSDELPALVRACLNYLTHHGKEKVVGLKAREALEIISGESKLNRLRLTRLYGVTSD